MRSPAGGPGRSSPWPSAWPSPSPCCGPNPSPGAAGAVVILAACAALATWPVNGRTGDQWLPVVVRWGAAALRVEGAEADGLPRWSPPAQRGVTADGRRARSAGEDPHRRSSCTARVSRCSAPTSRSGGWRDGRRSSPPWPGRAPRSGACSGWRRRFPIRARRARLPLLARHGRSGVGLRRVLRGAAERHGCRRLDARCRADRAGPAAQSVESAPRRCNASWRRSPASWPTPTWRWTEC